MSVYGKLAQIQKELVAPKGQYNNFGKYNYRSCEDILKALKPLCDANNCVLFITNELEAIGDRNYVKAIATLVDIETNEQIVSTAHAREEDTKKGMDGSQITGASSSYARKYALAGLFCIDNEKDSDATNEGDNKQIPKEEMQKEVEARAKVIGYVNKVKMSKENIEKLCKHFGVNSLNELNLKQCNDYLKMIEEKEKSNE